MTAYKLFRVHKSGHLQFLYHTHNGSSIVPRNVWLKTKMRWVHNPGSKNQKKYRSGFQFFSTRPEAEKFQRDTGGKYVLVVVQVKSYWMKPRSRAKAMMAQYLCVPCPTTLSWLGAKSI